MLEAIEITNQLVLFRVDSLVQSPTYKLRADRLI